MRTEAENLPRPAAARRKKIAPPVQTFMRRFLPAIDKPVLCALAAAFLFALSVPAGKLLLGRVGPLWLSALCYLGGGLGLLLYKLLSGGAAGPAKEATLEKKDLPYVVGFVAAGGALAPAFLFTGLKLSSSSAASLMLNFELVFTALIAVVVFREHGGRRLWLAAGLIMAGGMALALEPGGFSFQPGLALVALAGLFWALDNNLTARVSLKDPVTLSVIKGLAGGCVNAALAFYSGEVMPPPRAVLPALGLGFVSYGVSLALLVRAMRGLGAGRAGAFFGVYPFAGAVMSCLWLGEAFSPRLGIAFALAGSAAALLLGEKHAHAHAHEPLEHDHLHTHDGHHAHAHYAVPGAAAEHSHPHSHTCLEHSHEHGPDAHHRHEHQG